MPNERRKYPRVSLVGEVRICIEDEVYPGSLTDISPSGIQVECSHQLVEQLALLKTEAGLYPDFELKFNLPIPKQGTKLVTSICNVSYCRRLSQDSYYLGLSFVNLSESVEGILDKYIALAEIA